MAFSTCSVMSLLEKLWTWDFRDLGFFRLGDSSWMTGDPAGAGWGRELQRELQRAAEDADGRNENGYKAILSTRSGAELNRERAARGLPGALLLSPACPTAYDGGSGVGRVQSQIPASHRPLEATNLCSGGPAVAATSEVAERYTLCTVPATQCKLGTA